MSHGENIKPPSETVNMFFVLQLAGTGVLAVGLWLRFDSRTAGLFEGEESPSVFFTGKASAG